MRKLLIALAFLALPLSASGQTQHDRVQVKRIDPRTNGAIPVTGSLNIQGPAPWVDVQAYGAWGSGQNNTTATCTNGSTTVTLASAVDFQNGQFVAINHCGPATTGVTPTGLTVTPTGTTGATSYQYQVAACDNAGGCSAATGAVSIANGNATLSSTNYNALAWAGSLPANGFWVIYGRTSASMNFLGYASGNAFNDIGAAAPTAVFGVPGTPFLTAFNQWLATSISSGAGTTTLILAAAAGNTPGSTMQIYHDDSPPIQSAINAATVTGGSVYFSPPAAFYNCVSGLPFTLPSGVRNVHLVAGQGAQAQVGIAFARPPLVRVIANLVQGPVFVFDANLNSTLGLVTIDNLDVEANNQAIKLKDISGPIFHNSSFGVAATGPTAANGTALTDNSPVIVENTFWWWWDTGATSAPAGGYSIRMRGVSGTINPKQVGLVRLDKLTMAGGGINYDQVVAPANPGNIELHSVILESATTALFTITSTVGGTAFSDLTQLTFEDVSLADSSGSAAVLFNNGSNTKVSAVVMRNVYGGSGTAAAIKVNTTTGNSVDGCAIFSAGNLNTARSIQDNSGNPIGMCMSANLNGFDFIGDTTGANSLRTDYTVSRAGLPLRFIKSGDKQAIGGIAADGTHYFGIGGSAVTSIGYDTSINRPPATQAVAFGFGLQAPAAPTCTAGGGGSLTAGTYFYAVMALASSGGRVLGPDSSVTVGASGSAACSWTAVTALPGGSVTYLLYRTTSPGASQGTEDRNVIGGTPQTGTSFTDLGTSGFSEIPQKFNNTLTNLHQFTPSGLLASSITGTLGVANGGTGAASFTANGILYGNGSGPILASPAGSTGTFCLVETNGGTPTFGSCAGTAATALSSITAATVGNTVNNGDNAQVWNWALTTAGKSAFTFGENIASTATGVPFLMNIQTLAASTANPLQVTARGTANGIRVAFDTGTLSAIGTANINATQYKGGTASGTGTCGANLFVTGLVDAAGPTCTQPAFSNISGSIAIGQTPLTTRGDLLTVNATPALIRLALGTNGQVLTSNGSDVTWAAPAVSSVFGRTGAVVAAGNDYNFNQLAGSIALAQTPLTTLGDILSVNSTPALARVAGNTTVTKQYLSSTGTGTVSALPVFSQVNFSDLAGTATKLQLPTTAVYTDQANTFGSFLNKFSSPIDLTGTSALSEVTNDATTGTTLNNLAKINAAGNAVLATTADTGIPVFIVVGNPGTGGSAQLAVGGQASCVFDGSGGVVQHFVVLSSTTNGRCKDGGAASPSGWVIGQLLNSPAANANGVVQLSPGYNGSASAAASWSSLTNPSANLSLSMAANSSTFTNNSGTGAANMWSFADTWNLSTFAGPYWKTNITDTSSAAGALLFDWQVGGVSKFKVDKTGAAVFGGTVQTGGGGPACSGGTAGAVCLNEGTAISGVTAADILYASSTQKTLTMNANSTGAVPIGGTVCVNITPVTVSANVTTDQNLLSCTLGPNQLNVIGKTLRIWGAGVYTTPAASTATINLKVKLCTISGCGSGTVVNLVSITSSSNAGGITNDPFNFSVLSTTQTAGASSVYEAHGGLTIDLAAATTAAATVFPDTNTAVSSPVIDSTGTLFVQVTAAFSVASASNSATHRQLVVEIMN